MDGWMSFSDQGNQVGPSHAPKSDGQMLEFHTAFVGEPLAQDILPVCGLP